MAATTSHYHQPVTSTASDDSNDDIRAERGGRRMSSGLLVEGEDIGGGVSWSTIILGEIIFLYGAPTNTYVVLSAMAVENNETKKKRTITPKWRRGNRSRTA